MIATLYFLFVVAWPLYNSAHALRLSFETCSAYDGRKVALITHDGPNSSQLPMEWFNLQIGTGGYSVPPFLQTTHAQLVIGISHEDSNGFLQIPELGDYHVLMHPDCNPSTKCISHTSGVHADVIQQLLAKECTGMQIDIDIVWKANPFEDIKDPKANTLVVTDGGESNNWNRAGHTHLWDCFARLTPKTFSTKCSFLVKLIEATRHFTGNEHGSLNYEIEICGEKHVLYDMLPFQWYADGLQTHCNTTHITHANDVGEKRKRDLVDEGHGYGEDEVVVECGGKEYRMVRREKMEVLGIMIGEDGRLSASEIES